MNILKELIKNENDIHQLIVRSIRDRNNLLLTYFNQHCFNNYIADNKYRTILDQKFTVFFDGVGVYYALKFLGYKVVERFNATDFYAKLFLQFSKDQNSIFIIGGNFSEELIKEKSNSLKLNIAGYKNGYFIDSEMTEIANEIIQSKPDYIIIGMGVPQQEIFAFQLASKIDNHIIFCVGNFLEFYFETQKRAPLIMLRVGLEWFFRLLIDPVRLWRRYVIGIPLFIIRIIKFKFSQQLAN